MHIHLFFVTKHWRGVLDRAMLACSEAATRRVRGDVGGQDDHVHLLV
jgi:hypothetical protein